MLEQGQLFPRKQDIAFPNHRDWDRHSAYNSRLSKAAHLVALNEALVTLAEDQGDLKVVYLLKRAGIFRRSPSLRDTLAEIVREEKNMKGFWIFQRPLSIDDVVDRMTWRMGEKER